MRRSPPHWVYGAAAVAALVGGGCLLWRLMRDPGEEEELNVEDVTVSVLPHEQLEKIVPCRSDVRDACILYRAAEIADLEEEQLLCTPVFLNDDEDNAAFTVTEEQMEQHCHRDERKRDDDFLVQWNPVEVLSKEARSFELRSYADFEDEDNSSSCYSSLLIDSVLLGSVDGDYVVVKGDREGMIAELIDDEPISPNPLPKDQDFDNSDAGERLELTPTKPKAAGNPVRKSLYDVLRSSLKQEGLV